MKIYVSSQDIKKSMERAEIKHTDHQLLAVMWTIAFQLARIAEKMPTEPIRVETTRG